MYKGQLICLIIIMFLNIFQMASLKKGAFLSVPSKWYSFLLNCSFFQLIFDMWSVYTVNHLDTVSPVLNRVVHMFYMGLMLLIFYGAFKYLEIVVEEEIGDRVKKVWFADVIVVASIAGVIFLPLEYIETPLGNYSFGPAAFVIYIGVALFLLLIIRNLVKYWKDIPIKKRMAMFIVIITEVAVALYQVVVPTALISCLAIVLLNLGIYLTTENPDAVLVEMLEKETKRADVANQAKTDFLAKMSHEIRTPINAIIGMNETILRESNDKEILEYAMDIESAAHSLLAIINDILDITKIEAGKLSIIPAEYDLSSLLNDVTNIISYKAQAKSLEFKLCVEESIPNKLMGDDIRIRQILVNLLNNAVKYTNAGKVTLEVKQLAGDESGHTKICFSVKDTGIGIKEEDIAMLYVPFNRIEEEKNRNIEGTGLGMAITLQLLELMGSSLEVTSEYGVGSTFSFVLDQAVMDETAIGNLEARMQSNVGQHSYSRSFVAPKAHVLVIDDNAVNLKVFANLLKATQVQVDVAESGREGIEKVRNTHYDIIFLDHMMPEMDGIETLHRMKALEDSKCKETPIVALTANAIIGAKEMYLAEGFSAFMSKPIAPDKLEEMIVKLLPKELVLEAKPQTNQNGKSESKSISQDEMELPIIEGLDLTLAFMNLRSEALIRETLISFYWTNETEAAYLEEQLHALEQNPEAIDLYRIKVHSMKSVAALIGAAALSEQAKTLEYAARDKAYDIIYAQTNAFLKDWRSYREPLKVMIPEVEKKELVNKETVFALLERLQSAMENMDIDEADSAMDAIRAYEYSKEVQELVEPLGVAVINLDEKNVTVLVEKMTNALKNEEV